MAIHVQSKNEGTGGKYFQNGGVRTSKIPLLHESNENTGKKKKAKLTFSELYELTSLAMIQGVFVQEK